MAQWHDEFNKIIRGLDKAIMIDNIGDVSIEDKCVVVRYKHYTSIIVFRMPIKRYYHMLEAMGYVWLEGRWIHSDDLK